VIQVVVRNREVPSVRKTRKYLSFLFAPVHQGSPKPLLTVKVRNNYVFRTGCRAKTLRIGILLAATRKTAVLLYRKLQWPEQRFPVFTPHKRPMKAYGLVVAPQTSTGQGGTGMDVDHYLGLSFIHLGGTHGF